MGRFYSTNVPRSVDYAYKPPFELMMQAIANSDAQTNNIYDKGDLLDNELSKINALEQDQTGLNTKRELLRQQINGFTEQISKDPLNWKRAMPGMRDLSRVIQRDLTGGELAKIQENRKALDDFDAASKQQIHAGLLDPKNYEIARGKMLRDFAGTSYDSKSGGYNKFSPEGLVNTPDITGIGKEASEKIMADLTDRTWDDTKGMYIRRHKRTGAEVTEQQVAEMVDSALRGDPRVASYLKQGARLGYMNPNLVDKQGNLLPSYTQDAQGNLVYNPHSPLSGIVRSRALSQSYKNESTEDTSSANPFALQNQSFRHQLAVARAKPSSRTGGPGEIDGFGLFHNTFNKERIDPKTGQLVSGFTKSVPVPEAGKGVKVPGKAVNEFEPLIRDVLLSRLPQEEQAKYKTSQKNPNWKPGDNPDAQYLTVDGKSIPSYYLTVKESPYEKQIKPTPQKNGKFNAEGLEAGGYYRLPNGMIIRHNAAGDDDIVDDVVYELRDEKGEIKSSATRDIFNIQLNNALKGTKNSVYSEEANNVNNLQQ